MDAHANTDVLFVWYPRCSTCRKAKAWLEANGIGFVERHIVDDPPTDAELRAWLDKSGLAPRRLFNTSGKRYRELNMKERFAEGIGKEECLELLAGDGMLVKRPVLVTDKTVLVGFREDAWAEALGVTR